MMNTAVVGIYDIVENQEPQRVSRAQKEANHHMIGKRKEPAVTSFR